MAPKPTPEHGAARDPVAADSEHYNVELETDRVRVLRIKYAPGENSIMHRHPVTIAIFLNNATFRIAYPDGRSENGTARAGDVMHLGELEHLPENTGQEPFEVITVELKPSIAISPYRASRPA
jgi:hypothetical protein